MQFSKHLSFIIVFGCIIFSSQSAFADGKALGWGNNSFGQLTPPEGETSLIL